MAYHAGMETLTCRTPGHEDKPQHGTTGLCQACYRRGKRLERGLQKPGPKPDPTRPFSRYNLESSHHLKRVQCEAGHRWIEGSYKVRSDGRRVCLICIEEKRLKGCPAGHAYTPENTYKTRNTILCRTCVLERKAIRDRLIKYGITPEKLSEMLEAQEYACGICGNEFDLDAKYPFAVDHDHSCCPGEVTCGKCVRELLCLMCNTGLGRFKDDIALLQSAIAYLRQYQLKEEA